MQLQICEQHGPDTIVVYQGYRCPVCDNKKDDDDKENMENTIRSLEGENEDLKCEIETLKDRIRTLDERIEELKGGA